MFKKSIAVAVTTAFLIANPGTYAAAQTMGRGAATGVSVTPTLGTGLGSPISGGTSFNTAPVLLPGALNGAILAPSLAPTAIAPAAVPTALKPAALAASVTPAAAKPVLGGANNGASALNVIRSNDANVGVAEKGAALNVLFDQSGRTGVEALEVMGAYAPSVETGLGRSETVSAAKAPAAVEKAKGSGSILVTVGVGAAVVAIVAAVSKPFRALLARGWNAFLGIFGMGVKKLETPEVMAQRIIDQLNQQKPIYNQKVADASTLVEKLKLQVAAEEMKVADAERDITALLSDSDPTNDILATGLINQQKTLNASIAASKEQIVLAEQALAGIKEDRQRFFSEREEMLAKIQAGLTKAKAAEIQKEIAKLKGGFEIGDLKDNMDRFEDAVNDKVADAKGHQDSADSNPDQVLKKAKDALKSQEVQDEIARRKAAIEAAKKDKGQASGGVTNAVRAAFFGINVLTAVWAGLNTGWIALLLGAGAFAGFIIPLGGIGAIAGAVFAEKVMKTSGAKTAGMGLLGGVIGFGIGVVGMIYGGYLGYAAASATAAWILGVAAAVTGLLDLGWKAVFKKDAKSEGSGLVMELGIGAAVVAVAALVSRPFRNLLARVWNAFLGLFGMGVKKMETPEVMAQRIIDELNAQKPVYNRKVQEASTLVEKLRLQIEKQSAQSAELDRSVTAILSDSDPLNDVMAETLLNQKKTVDASTAMTQEQLTLSEKTLADIKDERVRFFSDREEMLAKINAGLTKSKAAEIQKEIAKLKGGFQIGDLKDNMDRFEDAVNDKVADAKGHADSADSNPDQILKKAKDALKNSEVQDEIARRKAAIEAAKKDKAQGSGLILELGIGAAVVAVVALVSRPFRNLLARVWNAFLGIFGMGVKKLETPEVMAQRIIDELNAQKPVYNRKVQEASTLVEKLRLQIEKQEGQSKELDRSVTAILSDSDPLNDVMAETLLNQKKTVDASTVMTKEQLAISEKTLADIKDERVRFFSEREEMLARVNAGLTKAKAAEIQKEIAKLKGGFEIGDLKDNMDKFEDAVNDKIADAKGHTDSADSNPDQILKKAKDSLKNQEVQDEIARRKAAIEAAKKDKGQASGDASQSKALGHFAKIIGIGFALISPWLASAVFALLGLVSIAMAPEQGRWFGRQLAVIGLGTLAIGGAATLLVAKVGLSLGAFGVGISFVVPAGIALAAGVIAALRARSKANGAVAAAAATPAGSSVLTPAPVVSAPAETSAPKSEAGPKASFSLKPLFNLLSRMWNALLGIFGMGVKKLETPEIMAQRLIDQLNDAKPVYNTKVAEASTLVEKLRLQIGAEAKKIAEFDKTITALLSDSDPANDIQAGGLINSQKTLEASIALSQEQLAAAEKGLEGIKQERARFFAEREEALAKIQAGLTKVKAAEIQKEIAKLKGGFQVGDLKDNMDRFDGAVADKVADAKGHADAAATNPDEVLKKAKESLRTQEIADELARRKAAIEAAKNKK